MQNKNTLHWGYIAGIVSGITYGMNPLFGVPVINKGLDVNSLLFYRYGVATLLMLAYMLVAKRQIRITWKQFGLMAILGVLFTGCSITHLEVIGLGHIVAASGKSVVLFTLKCLTGHQIQMMTAYCTLICQEILYQGI